MNEPTLVRPAVPGDLESLCNVLTYLHGEPPWSDANAKAAARTVEEILADDDRRLMLATINDTPVGTIDVIVSKNLTHDLRPFALIENVVVLPTARRKGVARQMVGAAFDFAESRGCYKIQLVSANKRDAAHYLYKAMGFHADVTGYRRYLAESRD